MAQDLCQEAGSFRENLAPVAYLEIEEGGNVADAYAADGTQLAQIAYRPYEEAFRKNSYLFLC